MDNSPTPLSRLTDSELQSFAQLMQNSQSGGLSDEAVEALATSLGLPSQRHHLPQETTAADWERVLEAEASLEAFVEQAWHVVEPGVEYKRNWHIQGLCLHLEALFAGQITNLISNQPAGTMKSLTACVMFPAWVWIHKPETRFLFASHDQSLSTRDSVRCRQVIQSAWYRRHWGNRFKLTGDQNEKCLAEGTHITMADGRPRPIETLQPGDRILSIDQDTGKATIDRVKHAWCNGHKPTRRMLLSDGSSIEATLNHRFFCWDDWRHVGDMHVGDAIAVLRNTPATEEASTQDELDEAFLLALWLSEGAKNASVYSFTTTDPAILQRARAICTRRNWRLSSYTPITYGIAHNKPNSRTGDTPLNLLRRHRVAELKTDTIRIPDAIFSGSRAVGSEFIGTYLACDGHVATKSNKGLSWFSASERMMRDLQALLKRWGVQSRLYRKPTTHKPSWALTVHAASEYQKLAHLNAHSKQTHLHTLLTWAAQQKRHTGGRNATVPPEWKTGYTAHQGIGRFRQWASRKTVTDYADKHGLPELQRRMASDLDWRRITKIEDSEARTWHIETEATGTFVAEGIYSHNTKFENDKRGWRIATSTGGRGLGEHPDVLVVDDSNAIKDAGSILAAQAVIDWWDGLVSTRGQTRGIRKAVIGQRIEENDLCGHILSKHERDDEYTHLILPMRYEPGRMPPSPIGWTDPRTEEGELLWPEVYTEKRVAQMERDMGPLRAAGQLQQRPVPIGGNLAKRDWFILKRAAPRDMIRRVRYWDKAGTKGGGAFTVGLLMGVDRSGTYWVEDVVRDQLSAHERNKLILMTATLDREQWGQVEQRFEVEPGSGGKESWETTLRLMAGFYVTPDRVSGKGDKTQRFLPFAAQAEGGNVRLVIAAWNNAYLDELSHFPLGRYKDQADASSGAFAALTLGGSSQTIEGDFIASGDPESAEDERRAFTDDELNELPEFLRDLVLDSRSGRREQWDDHGEDGGE